MADRVTKQDPTPTKDVDQSDDRRNDKRSSLDRLTEFTKAILKVPGSKIKEMDQ